MNLKGLRPTDIPADYPTLLQGIKKRIRSAQVRATLSANAELVQLYWDIGRTIDERQRKAGWGTGVIPRLARDIHNELPEVKGFSERNIMRMVTFYRAYPRMGSIVPQAAAQLPGSGNPTAGMSESAPVTTADSLPSVKLISTQIPWFHHVLLLEKIKDLPTRLWYMQQTIASGWSRSILDLMIEGGAHLRQGKAVTNFPATLPAPQSDLAAQTLKDPYIFDFLTLDQPFRERELETGLLSHLQKFLLELGQGFAFVGRQYRVEVGEAVTRKSTQVNFLFLERPGTRRSIGVGKTRAALLRRFSILRRRRDLLRRQHARV
jgi:predicted nuclease of restriction endonuclease-like (RecB) superfamily